MRLTGACLAAAALMFAPVNALAAEEAAILQLERNGGWVLDYDTDSCALRRSFGPEGQRVILELRKFAPVDNVQMTLFSPDINTAGSDIAYRFTSTDAEAPDSMGYFLRADSGGGIMISTSLAPASVRARASAEDWDAAFDDAARATFLAEFQAVELTKGFGRPLALQVGSLTSAMAAMNTCLDDMMGQWGIDVAAHQGLQRRAAPRDLATLARRVAEVYPRQMLQQHEMGAVHLRVMLDAEGNVTDCVIQAALGDEDFQETACRRVRQHGRFVPALDATGQAIPSYWVTTVQYALPGG